MPLSTNVPRASAYLEEKSVLFDTCAFTWFAKSPNGMIDLERVLNNYRVLVPTPVIYELAFGADEQVHENESKIWRRIHQPTNCLDLFRYHIAQRQKSLPRTGLLVINPGFNEWWTARTRLLGHIGVSSAKPKIVKQKHSLDALIHATARNCFTAVCTANVDDFEKLNSIAAQSHHDGPVPLFHPESVVRSLSETIHYEYSAA